MTGTATILRADARALPLADASVDLIVTSPPYFALRSYTDGGEHYEGQIGSEETPAEWLQNMLDCTREWMRVLKPSGSLWVNLGDKYAAGHGGRSSEGDGDNIRVHRDRQAAAHWTGEDSHPSRSRAVIVPGFRPKSLMLMPQRYAIRCVDDLGLILRAEVIWSKPSPIPEGVVDRVRRTHEQWFHFTLRPRYFADIDAIRERHPGHGLTDTARGLGHARTSAGDGTLGDRTTGTRGTVRRSHPLGRVPSSVWEIPSEQFIAPPELEIDHYAAFPTEWPRRLIKGWSPAGGTVLDPFGGTGTTALVASVLGRVGISADRSADYCRLARWRTTDPGQLAKAARLAPPVKQVDGQQDLLAELGEAS